MTSKVRREEAIAVARTSLIAVGGLLAYQLIFNIAAACLGWPRPFANFLCCQGDYFADYFKFVLSYPGGSAVELPDWWIVREQIAPYLIDNPYRGAQGLGGPYITHLHVPPLSTLYSLANLWAMRWVDPLLLFCIQLIGILCYWWHIVHGAVAVRRAALLWFIFGLISYPALMMVARGNLFAAFAGLAIIHALALALQGRGRVAGALLLAVAINIRPNAAIFALIFLLLHWPRRNQAMLVGATATMGLFTVCMFLSGWIYPDYDLPHFFGGLQNYYQRYVVEGGGVAYGSSLSGALAFLFSHRPGLDRLALLLSVAPFLIVLAEHVRHRVDPAILLFASCATYALASTVFADYHLLPFLLVPIAITLAPANDGAMLPRREFDRTVALVASLLVLSPKNYLFDGVLSWQVMLNPAILLTAMLLLCGSALFQFRVGRHAMKKGPGVV